jgi:hypothetical protein
MSTKMQSSTTYSMFTSEFMRDVNTNPILIDLMKKICRGTFQTNPTDIQISKFVDFIYNFIDYEKLLESPHATEWKGLSIMQNGDECECEAHLKKQFSDILMNVLTKQTYNEKVDNTFDSFIKRIICNVIGDVCGGFKVTDLRPPAKDQVDAMQYIRDNKQTYMRTYISDQLFKAPTGGFVVCLENDHGCVFSGKGVGSSNMKNIVYKKPCANLIEKDKDAICYIQFDPTIHKANQAKGIYYTGNYSVSEVCIEDIQSRMIACGFSKDAKTLLKYKDRVSVCSVHNKATNKHKDSFWYKKKYLIILHNKSVGTKKDIKKNAEEYACMRKLIDSYATQSENTNSEDVFVLGDFNLPLWGKDNGYLKLNPEDQKTYPIQESYDGDHDTFMTKNLELYSTWDNDEVGFKDRTADWMQNSQAGGGKRTIPEDGPRNYHTDMVFGNIKLADGSNPVILESKLHPNPNAATGVAFPMVGPELTWFSDHQAMEMTMTDTRGEAAAFTVNVLNTLSDCCSGQQHFKRSFNKNTVERLRQEFATLLVEFIKNCVTFDDDIKTMLLDTVCEAEPNAEYDTKDSIRRSLMSEFNECVSNVSLHTIMNETEYNLFKLLIVGFAINYMLWYTFAFVKIMNTTTEE